MYVDMISCLRSRSEPFPLPSQGCKVACRPGWLLRRLGLDPSRMDLDVSTIVATCLCLAEGEVVGDDDEEEEEEDEDGGGTRMAQQVRPEGGMHASVDRVCAPIRMLIQRPP